MTKDVCDNVIRKGATVALAKRSGNSAEMVIRKVLEVEGNQVKVEAPSGRSGWTYSKNLVVIPEQ